MIRIALVLIFVVLFLLIGCIPALVLWLIGKKNPGLKDRVSRHMIRWAFRVILFLSGTKIIAEGTENIPADKPVLYVGNHRSYFDIVISYCLFPGLTGYVAKKEMAKIPLLSLWMRYIRCLFLDRSDIKQGLKTILAGIEQVKSGISICIYPEGTRNQSGGEGTLLEFKEGSLKIAEKSGCPVIPMAMTHTADILEKHMPLIRRTTVHVRFGEPIDIRSLPKEEKKFAGAYTRKVIQGMLEDMLRT